MGAMKWHGLAGISIGLLLWNGCSQEQKLPPGNFQLTIRPIISNAYLKSSILDLSIQPALKSKQTVVSVKYENGNGGGGNGTRSLSNNKEGKLMTGEVFLSAAKMTPGQLDDAYIQTMIFPRKSTGDSMGMSMFPVPKNTKLDSYLTLSVTNGIYALDKPIKIAELNGGPVTLTVQSSNK
jgi:hypothetical protein